MCVDASLNSIQDLLARWRGGGVTPSAFVVTAPQEEKTHARVWIIRGHQRFEFRAEDRANLPLVSTEISTFEVLSYFGLHCFDIACPGLSKCWTRNPLAVVESLLLCRTLRIGCLRSTSPCGARLCCYSKSQVPHRRFRCCGSDAVCNDFPHLCQARDFPAFESCYHFAKVHHTSPGRWSHGCPEALVNAPGERHAPNHVDRLPV